MSTNGLSECPNCGAKIKSSLIGSNKILDEEKTEIINEYHQAKAANYCDKCGTPLYEQYRTQLVAEANQLMGKIKELIGSIPVISIQSPFGWEYEIVGMVTAQSTTGTGVFSEFTSSWTDLFGMQSNRYNSKLKAGEGLCFAKLRKRVLELDAHAVIAADIDYAEVGGEKGMLMVCIAGTAVKLKNLQLLGEKRGKDIATLEHAYSRHSHLVKMLPQSTED